MARYTSPTWWGHPRARHQYYGDPGSGRSGCYLVSRETDGTWYVNPPNDEPWPGIVFADLQAAKTWVEIEASNHV